MSFVRARHHRSRASTPDAGYVPGVRVYRWDLDKTYLLTEFDRLRDLWRIATEPATAKRSVPGAAPLLRGLGSLDRKPAARIYMLSGSPVQMRPVLEEKLRLDGVRVDTLVLKDSLGNLRRGRLRAIRGQFGYKLPSLLRARVGLGRAVRETCFGDDAEVDALVYSLYADVIAGRVAPDELARVLDAAGAYPDAIAEALDALRRVGQADVVDRIFIRRARGRPESAFAPLGTRVFAVTSWLEAAIVLHGAGELDVGSVEHVRAACAIEGPPLAALFEAILIRGWVVDVAMHRMLDALVGIGVTWEACRPVLERGGHIYVPPAPPAACDYVEVVRAFAQRG